MYIRVVANYKFESYWKLMMRLFYSTNFWFIWGFIFVPVLGITSCFAFSDYSNRIELCSFFLLWLLLFPTYIYFSSKRKFYSNGKLSNPVVFEITDEKMTITTTSSTSTLRWGDNCYLIKEFNNWVIIYRVVGRNTLPIEVIPKDALTSEQLSEIQQITSPLATFWQNWKTVLIVALVVLFINIILLLA